MKRGFVFLTVLAIAAMLLAGCGLSGAPSPMPGQTTPESTPMPGQTTPEPTPTPSPSTKSTSSGPSTGTLTVLVTDAPSYQVVNVVVHFLRVEVHRAADGPEGDGVWEEIPLEKLVDDQTFFEEDDTRKIDLNADMGEVVLAQDDQVEAGSKYTQIRVYMEEGEEKGATVTYIPDPDDLDENDVPITKPVDAKLPSGKLRFIRPFVVEADTETRITLDFDLQKSVVFTGASQSEDIKVIVKPVVKLLVTPPSDECNTDAELTLENKDPDWEIIGDDGIYGELRYSTEGEEFCYEFEGYGLDDIEYSLIYYADAEDRFNDWGGNNPGALIDSGTAFEGSLTLSGSVNLREDLEPAGAGIDLPHLDDANRDHYNYKDAGDPPEYTGDGYDHAHGAKIWLVPSEYYDAELRQVTDWEPTTFLFETDLITFDDTDNEYEPLE